MIQERIWVILAIMMIIPFAVPLVLPSPYSWFAMPIMSLGLLFILRRNFKNMTKGILGSSDKLICSGCGNNKFDNLGGCKRCGSKHRRLG